MVVMLPLMKITNLFHQDGRSVSLSIGWAAKVVSLMESLLMGMTGGAVHKGMFTLRVWTMTLGSEEEDTEDGLKENDVTLAGLDPESRGC